MARCSCRLAREPLDSLLVEMKCSVLNSCCFFCGGLFCAYILKQENVNYCDLLVICDVQGEFVYVFLLILIYYTSWHI